MDGRSGADACFAPASWVRRRLQSPHLACLAYATVAAGGTIHRGAPDSTDTTFKIFRQSFWHLVHATSRDAHDQVEPGAAAVHLCKCSPTAGARKTDPAVTLATSPPALWLLLRVTAPGMPLQQYRWRRATEPRGTSAGRTGRFRCWRRWSCSRRRSRSLA